MIYAYLVASSIVFVELFIFLNIRASAIAIVAQSRDSMAVLTSREMSDEEKEPLVRRASLNIFVATLVFLVKFLFIAAALFGIYWALVAIFPELHNQIVTSLVSPIVVLVLTVIALLYAWVRNVVLEKL